MQPDPRPAAPVLVLLHGATLNAHMWDAVRRHLAPGYRVIAPDLPGHGARRGEPFTMAGAVDTVLASVATAAGAPVVLVGDSLGGYAAQAAAPAIPPGQLKGLVLGGSTAILTGPACLPYLATVGMFRAMIALFGEPWLIRHGVERSMRGQGVAEPDIAAMVDAGLAMRAFGPAVAAIRQLDVLANLPAIAAPILFINGRRDTGMVRGEARCLAHARDGRVEHFAQCGHGVSMLRSARFAALVNQFAGEVCATR